MRLFCVTTATALAQKASVEALNGPQGFIDDMKVEFVKRRDYLVAELNKIDGVTCAIPGGAFYAFPNVSGIYGGKVNSSNDLALYLLEEANVALVHGEAFGDDDFVRISYATSMEDIEKAVVRIKEALGKFWRKDFRARVYIPETTTGVQLLLIQKLLHTMKPI